MPITLPPISRRRFLSASLVAAASALTGCSHITRVDRPTDPNRFALLSDTHVHFDRTWLHNGKVNTWNNFTQVSQHILAQPTLPAASLVSGDCVYLQGRSDDYITLAHAVAPLRQNGMSVHLALGNHDHRGNFWAGLHNDPARQKDLDDRHALIVPSPCVNWFLLDSLDITNNTPGSLGPRQLAWLARSLDARADKPAIIVIHHDPDEKTKPSGLVDTKALFDVLMPRKQVKAYIYGHTHLWQHAQRDGLHLLNLPPTAWVFSPGRPNGYVAASLRPDGATFQLHTLEPAHSQNGQTIDLGWR